MELEIMVGIVGLILMLILIFAGLPLPVMFFVIGFFGAVLLRGWEAALSMATRAPWVKIVDFNFSVIPLFVMLSIVLFEYGVGENMFRAMQRWLGHFSGGMAAATSAACAFLGTITGAAPAATALMAKVAYPEMRKFNYEPALSLAVCCASSTVAMMIPPSTALVIYAIITEQSIAQCLLAGFIPGFLSMGIYMVMILIRARFNPALGPAAPAAVWRERFIDLRYIMPGIIMMLTIIGGLYFGIFTATEAAGAAALIAFIIVLAMRRLTSARLKASIYETVRLSILILLILVTIRGFFLTFLHITWLTITIAELALKMPSPWLVLAMMFLICFLLGMFTGGPMALVILPLFTPVVEQMGFSAVWFIITVVKMMEVGWITPPVAPGIFIATGVIREVPMGKAFVAVWWFVLCDIFTLGLFIAFPEIITFLPDTMMAAS